MSAAPKLAVLSTIEATQWYAVQTRYRFEKKVTSHLQRKGLDTFLPLLEQVHGWSDREQPIQIPLFPGYTFSRFDPHSKSRLEILRTEGVLDVISFNGNAAPIPAKQIEDLRVLLAHRIPCAIHAFLKVGQKVRIRGGCLDGLEGILEESGSKHLVISLESIHRSAAIRIEGYELEMI